ncbi:flavin-containing monooxygenase [Salininema proteolyticum]|uniref:Flavin-containing monooxygenase n=1 Tax=Salininema proteolyticum TaxID=1607685 RepID=A0ABV8U5H4_9ACTN
METTVHNMVIVGAGQAGLSTAAIAKEAGIEPVLIEAGDAPVGSWPHYYDSLRLFSPRELSTLPGRTMEGAPTGYPGKEEIIEHFRETAEGLGVEIRTGTRVVGATVDDDLVYHLEVEGGETVSTRTVVAATGSFGNPHRPDLPGLDGFTGSVVHSAEYRSPSPYEGQRVLVVGAGNTGVQLAVELRDKAEVSLVRRKPVVLVDPMATGRDFHYELFDGFGDLPFEWLGAMPGAEETGEVSMVVDIGGYRELFERGEIDVRDPFLRLEGDSVVWGEEDRERADAVILATGYRPAVGYLEGLGVLDEKGNPRHRNGLSLKRPGIAFVGFDLNISLYSNSVHGAVRDAEAVMPALSAYISRAFEKGFTGFTSRPF